MGLTTKPPFKEIQRRYKEFKARLYRNIGQIAANFFKDNFTRQGFLDGGRINAWRKRREHTGRGAQGSQKTRSILIGTGRLRKSIRVVGFGEQSVTVGTDIKYARIHNEGGIITQTPTAKQRAFFWRMFYLTKNDMWRNAAMAETIKIRIPKRKFIGSSTDLAKEIERFIRLSIIRIFKKQ